MRRAARGRILDASPSRTPTILSDFAAVRAWRDALDVRSVQERGRLARVGFVPTMGALHEGHLSLFTALDGVVDEAVSSIFVNPAQFAPHEDFDKYPRTLEDDLAKLATLPTKVAAVYTPSGADMYPTAPPYRTYVTPLEGEASGEGAARLGFFRGVATVVTKLFATARPTHSAFGQKDGYQCIVVRQLARDLNLGVDVRIVPTMRDDDGLAMSSRNIYLSEQERAAAPALYQALQSIRKGVEAGPGWDADSLRAGAASVLAAEGGGQFGSFEYVSIACAQTGRAVEDAGGSIAHDGALLVSVAAPIGRTRLIDNVVIVPGKPDLSPADAADYIGR